MFSSQSSEVSLESPCRALTAVRADRVDNRFLAGSCCVQQPNSIFMMRFHGDVNEISLESIMPFENGAVSKICCSPTEKDLLLTCTERSSIGSLWRMPSEVFEHHENEASDGPTNAQLSKVCDIQSSSPIVNVSWRDSSDDMAASAGDVLTIDEQGQVSLWDLVSGSAESTRKEQVAKRNQLATVAWDPHGNGDAIALACDKSVRILDWRADTSVPTGVVDSFQAHRLPVTDLDYNPNKPYTLATAGQDGLVKFWDLRAAKQPLLVARGGHSHWVSNVQYNPFHDQLLLSSGTDSLVNLWRVSTISSAPLLTLDNNDDGSRSETSAPNVRVCCYDQGDSVYGAAWGAADAWIYMTLSYDGKATLSHVPSKEKYKILL